MWRGTITARVYRVQQAATPMPSLEPAIIVSTTLKYSTFASIDTLGGLRGRARPQAEGSARGAARTPRCGAPGLPKAPAGVRRSQRDPAEGVNRSSHARPNCCAVHRSSQPDPNP